MALEVHGAIIATLAIGRQARYGRSGASICGQIGEYPAMTNRLREFRDRAHLTQGELGAKVGCGWQHISRMERGKRALSEKWARKIAPFVGTTWSDLMEPPRPTGLGEAATPFDGAPVPPPLDQDEVFATIQEAVAAQLAEHHLPNSQRDIYGVARGVERELKKFGEMARFPATLDLRVSEAISKLQRKWNEAKASL